MSATAMDNVRSATPGQVRRSPSVPAHWPIRRHVAAAETTPAGPLHSVEVTVPAKTNLTLHVGPAHEEWGGRHALDTIYCAIGVNDVVTATAKTPGSGFSLELSGEHLGDLASSGSDMRRNHAVLALFAIARAAGREPDVALHVDKHIPVGAGLGGGSADAAATLLAVNTQLRQLTFQLVDAAFSQRRKTLHAALKRMVPDEVFHTAGIDPTRRGETLTIDEFAALATALRQSQHEQGQASS